MKTKENDPIMELSHATDLLVEATLLSERRHEDESSIFDLLREAQERLGMSEGCRQLASRFIVRGSPYMSLVSWENDPSKQHSLLDMLNNGLKELANTPFNPYRGFIFCSCVSELQDVLLYG